MVVTMTVAGLAEVAVGSALAGGIIGGVGVKVHDMLKAGDYIAQTQISGPHSVQIQKGVTVNNTITTDKG